MSDRQKFYITTAIAYPNGRPHMGHAYEAIATDFIARFHRLDGRDVTLLTGTDEHGLKMVKTARDAGLEPRAFADTMVPHFEAMMSKLDISIDRFIRTSGEAHYRGVTELWNRMTASGDIYLDRYEGWYSVRDEAYYDESELIDGEGGTKLSPQGTPVEWTVEESYFFKLSTYADRLLELYETNPDFIQPASRRNEVLSFVRGGLKDLSVSRTSFDWGVPVPGDPRHVMYVWVDALTTYMTGIGWTDDMAQWERNWPADVHIIGKDIVRFHTVYWPAFLMSAGLPLPKTVFGHGFVLNRGEKMSKSLGNVVEPLALAETYGVDQLRYFLLREVPFGQDGSYSHDAIVARTNGDLANGLGNLSQRTLSMIAKNCDGRLPEPGERTAEDDALFQSLDAALPQVRAAMTSLSIHSALEAIWRLVSEGDAYISAQAPWALRKTDPARMATVLYNVAELVRRVAILAQPAMPGSCAALLDQLAVPTDERDFPSLNQPLRPGTMLPQPQGVFPRWVEPVAEATA
jgi:methionyl-tRNA synthetase